ncbi:hypothetical protein ACFU8I_40770, partial [Streptomyces sp. NPDC057540]
MPDQAAPHRAPHTAAPPRAAAPPDTGRDVHGHDAHDGHTPGGPDEPAARPHDAAGCGGAAPRGPVIAPPALRNPPDPGA